MLIIKGAVPAIARQTAIRALLTRIDVDRDRDRYDIYFAGEHGINFEYVNIHDQHYLNARVFGKKGIAGSFQFNLNDCDKVVII